VGYFFGMRDARKKTKTKTNQHQYRLTANELGEEKKGSRMENGVLERGGRCAAKKLAGSAANESIEKGGKGCKGQVQRGNVIVANNGGQDLKKRECWEEPSGGVVVAKSLGLLAREEISSNHRRKEVR